MLMTLHKYKIRAQELLHRLGFRIQELLQELHAQRVQISA